MKIINCDQCIAIYPHILDNSKPTPIDESIVIIKGTGMVYSKYEPIGYDEWKRLRSAIDKAFELVNDDLR